MKKSEYYIAINHQQYSDITREATRDEWDADDTSTTHSFNGYRIIPTDEKYWDFILPFNPNKKDLYLVNVIYSSGDSFHRDDGCLCMVSLVDNCEDAVKIRDAIKKDNDTKDRHDCKSSQLKVKLSNGKVEDIYCGTWQGYFESVKSVDIETLNFYEND